MIYILKTFGGGTIKITEKEFKAIANSGDDEMIYISSIKNLINKKTIAHCYPESQADEIEDKKQQMLGILHDGTLVRRHFGQWVMAYDEVPDDNGKYVPVKLDPAYYPEIAMDIVPSSEEYNKKYRGLPPEEILKQITAGKEPKRYGGNNQLEAIDNLLKV